MTGFENILIEDILNPSTLEGAIFFALLFLLLAIVVSTILRRIMRQLIRRDHKPSADRTAMLFLGQFAQVLVYLVAAILYLHLVPALRSLGTAILTTASVASIVIGLAAQNTLGNLISGVSLLLYRPVKLGDLVRVDAPTGQESGVVEAITLGYTTLLSSNDQKIVIPNSVMASNVIVNLGKSENT
jgi:small conductance mechanosensitive channel